LNRLVGQFLDDALLLVFMLCTLFNAGPAHDQFAALSVLPLSGMLSIATPSWPTDPLDHFALANLPLIVAALVAAPMLLCGIAEFGLRVGMVSTHLIVPLMGARIGFAERLIIPPAALALMAAWWLR
jgi:hypothetical protein